MFDLKGKVALVTGATGSIGTGIVHQLHSAGATVIAASTNIDRAKELCVRYQDRVFPIECDLNNNDEVNELISSAEKIAGDTIDILVNNAGINADTLALRMQDTDWEKVLKINLEVPFKLSKACIKNMMRKRWGRIINLSSTVAEIGNVGQTNYAASKAGLIGFSKSLAREVASRGITVNCISPGYVESPMVDKIPEKLRNEVINAIPLGRVGKPNDIAYGVVFLASEESSYITGQTLHINGGIAMV